MSLKAADGNRLDFSLEDLDDSEKKALAGWIKHFTSKYPQVGTLREFDGWDFGPLAEEIAEAKPFKSEEERAEDIKPEEKKADDVKSEEKKAADVTSEEQKTDDA